MMKTDLMPYQRTGAVLGKLKDDRTKSFRQLILTKENFLLLPMVFFLGRGSLLGGLMPFGMAAYAATLGFEFNRLLLAVVTLAGMISAGAREQIYVTVAGMLLFNAINIPFKTGKTKISLRFAAIAFFSVLVPQMVFVYLQGFLFYDTLIAVLYAFIVFVLVFIFRNAMPLAERGMARQKLSHEEIISGAITVALAISGFGKLALFGCNIQNILCVLVILIFSYQCGTGVGTSIGVTVGLLVSMSTTMPPLIIGSYAFCGLLAGVFRSLGKVGSGLGFVMGNAVLTLYLNGSTEVILFLREILIAIILFFLVPQKLMDYVSNTFSTEHALSSDKRNYSERIKEITMEKLNKFSRTFKELSKTFSEISETKVVTDKQDISKLFDRVADKVCRSCSLCLHCWDRNFYDTYQVMFKVIEKLDAKGWVDENDIPGHFLGRCERVADFVKAVNSAYEVFKVDMVWKSKVGESRELISQQLDGLSDVISRLATEINVDVHFKAELEDLIFDELNRAGIKTSEVIVYENKWGKYEINLFNKGCNGKRMCISKVEKLVSELAGRKMVKAGTECCQTVKNNLCSLRMIEDEIFKVTTGVAKLSKNEGTVSGDSYTFMSTGTGKYVVALSDGMGSGQKASNQSRATISLIEQFMESGFEKDLTVKLINSILVLRADDDSFTTIDMTIIDLFEGEAEFVKVGAVPTLIKKPERLEVVKSVTLPAGILCNVETDMIHKGLNNGDMIIMMTDGIVDAFQKQEQGEQLLMKRIETMESINPQEIANTVLEEAFRACGGNPVDDMTVLVAKVWKRV